LGFGFWVNNLSPPPKTKKVQDEEEMDGARQINFLSSERNISGISSFKMHACLKESLHGSKRLLGKLMGIQVSF